MGRKHLLVTSQSLNDQQRVDRSILQGTLGQGSSTGGVSFDLEH
jgi:hypothetical protein